MPTMRFTHLTKFGLTSNDLARPATSAYPVSVMNDKAMKMPVSTKKSGSNGADGLTN